MAQDSSLRARRARLRRRLDALRATPFPPGPEDPELDKVHARLARYEAQTRNLAARVLRSYRVELSKAYRARLLRRRMRRLILGGKQDMGALQLYWGRLGNLEEIARETRAANRRAWEIPDEMEERRREAGSK